MGPKTVFSTFSSTPSPSIFNICPSHRVGDQVLYPDKTNGRIYFHFFFWGGGGGSALERHDRRYQTEWEGLSLFCSLCVTVLFHINRTANLQGSQPHTIYLSLFNL
jgi:hypothetical protein